MTINTLNVTGRNFLRLQFRYRNREGVGQRPGCATAKGVQGKELRLSVQNPTLWSPSNPYLYDMTVSLSKDGKVLDEVKSYTAFRKISSKRDAAGIMRMQLNNQDYSSSARWTRAGRPDGLYTRPHGRGSDLRHTEDERLRLQHDSQACKSGTRTLVRTL